MSVRRLVLWVLVVAVGVLVFASAPALGARGDYVFSGSFGGQGSGPGEFENPAGVAVNEANGDVYVVDRGNDRVEYFSLNAATKAYEYVGEFNGSGLLLNEVVAAPTGRLSAPQYIAVDNDPGSESYGDVYVTDEGHGVIDKFSATGEYLYQLKEGAPGDPFGGEGPTELGGVAVAPDGVLWVAREGGYPPGTPPSEILSFSDARENAYVSTTALAEDFSIGGGAAPLGVNAAGDTFVDTYAPGGVREFDGSGEVPPFVGESANGIAVELPSGDVYIDSGGAVAIRSEVGSLLEEFGTGQLNGGGRGIAVNNSAPYGVYVANTSTNTVDIFTGVSTPSASVGEASGLGTEGAAVLNGGVDPEGEPVSSCEFEYAAASEYEPGASGPYKGHTASCEEPNATEISERTQLVPVHADLTGLAPNTAYDYRLAVSNGHATADSPNRSFKTSGPPGVEADPFRKITEHDVTLKAQVDTHGLNTTYTIQYGTSEAYGSTGQEGTLEGSFGGPVSVSPTLQEGALQPETTYYARIVVTNKDGTANGESITFTTLSSFTGLPDGRGYEMVSPLDNANGNVYEPDGPVLGADGYGEFAGGSMQAAADGDAVEYVAGAQTTGGANAGNRYVATREAGGGWTAVDLETQGFDAAPYEALLSSEFVNAGTEAVAAGSHVLSESEGNLYDSVGGRSVLVDVLPDGTVASDASFGSRSKSHVISADGSRIFWTDLGTGDLYVRENDDQPQSPLDAEGKCTVSSDACTVEVDASQGGPNSGGGYFWTASSDGSRVFFTDCQKLTAEATAVSSHGCGKYENLYEGLKGNDLYEYNVVTGKLGDLTVDKNASDPLGADVQGVVGASEDGEYVYFVADGVLAAGASTGNCDEGENYGSFCNLYLWHDGVMTFITRLSVHDNAIGVLSGETEGDWEPNLGSRTAEVTPNGRSVVFLSRAAYETDNEVQVYNADTNHIGCVSCNPNGEPPAGNQYPVSDPAWLPRSFSSMFMHHWISDDGTRVFFDSTEALVSQDTDGTADVYEWEREGTGSCERTGAVDHGGCIFLLSSGTSDDNSFLLDASANGDDVFIVTRARLVPQDQDENFNVFDVRVGASQPVSPPVCTGSGCQGVPAAPPIFATPASATFSGVGNFAAPTAGAPVKPKKREVKCARGKKPRHGKCVKAKRKSRKHARKPSRDRRTK